MLDLKLEYKVKGRFVVKRTHKVIGTIFGVMLLTFGLLNTNVFANSKQGIAHLVMEHEEKIKRLEELLKGGSNDSPKETLTELQKEEILAQFNYYYANPYEGIEVYKQIVDVKIVEDEMGYIFQVYLEGDVNWLLDINDYKSSAEGYSLARNMTSHVKEFFHLYNGHINVKVEFYDDGELVTSFVDMK